MADDTPDWRDSLRRIDVPQTFSFGGVAARHYLLDHDCDACADGYPKECEACGAGYVHGQWGDKAAGVDWLFTKCDQCGESE